MKRNKKRKSIKKNNKNLIYKRLGFLFIFLAVIGIGTPLVWAGFMGDYALLGELSDNEFTVTSTYGQQFVSTDDTTAPISGNDNSYNPDLLEVNNRLVIPKIGINMPVFLADNPNPLLRGGWMFPATSTPDKGGNTVIFGHRFRLLPPFGNTLYALDKVYVGDEITLNWHGQTYRYIVIESKIIEPTDFSVLNSTDTSRVTIITCSPLFSTKQRLVVIAELI